MMTTFLFIFFALQVRPQLRPPSQQSGLVSDVTDPFQNKVNVDLDSTSSSTGAMVAARFAFTLGDRLRK